MVTATSGVSARSWQLGFEEILPTIERSISFECRHMRPQDREEFTQCALALATQAYARLAAAGKLGQAYPSSLAIYACRQARGGRDLGRSLNVHDVSSSYAQRRCAFCIRSIHQADASEGTWKELLVEDTRANPADLAQARLDFSDWLAQLAPEKRRIANILATGAGTSETARLCGLTPGRISQIRDELRRSWAQFMESAAE